MINMLPMAMPLLGPSNSVVNYCNLFGGVAGYSTDELAVGNCIATNGTLTMTDWIVGLQVACGILGSGKGLTLTVRINGVSTSMTVTFMETALTALWATSGTPVVFNPGDQVTLMTTPINTPTITGSKWANWSVRWSSSLLENNIFTTQGGNAQTGANALAAGGGTLQLGPQWGGGHNPFISSVDTGEASPCTVAGTIKCLWVNLSDDPTSAGAFPSDNITVTMYHDPYVGGVNTGRVATSLSVVAGATRNNFDTAHSFAVAVGDQLSFKVSGTSNIPLIRCISIGWVLVPTNPGECAIMGESTPSAGGVTQYHWLIGSTATPTETIAEIPMFPCTLKNLFFKASALSSPPTNIASGQSFAMTVRKNAFSSGVPSNLSASASNGMYANDTADTVSVLGTEKINMLTVTSASAGVSCLARWGLTIVVPQGYFESVSDSYSLSDGRSSGYGRPSPETYNLSESRFSGAGKGNPEALAYGDNLLHTPSKFLSDVAAYADSRSVFLGMFNVDSIPYSDSKVSSTGVPMTENYILTDAKTYSVFKVLFDNYGITDVRSAGIIRGLLDILIFLDGFGAAGSGAHIQSMSESILFSDSRHSFDSKNLIDTLILLDAISKASNPTGLSAFLTDILSLSDRKGAGLIRMVSDLYGISDQEASVILVNLGLVFLTFSGGRL